MTAILVLNAGSSSIKFAIFEPGSRPQSMALTVKGQVAQRGAGVELIIKNAAGVRLAQTQITAAPGGFDHDLAITQLLAWFDQSPTAWSFKAIGHRVVHGGRVYSAPTRLTDQVLLDLDALVPLAPLHQAHNLKVIRLMAARWPSIPQVACFDTAFHTTQPEIAQAYALPRAITDAGVRRFGFHGLSYEYIATQLPQVLGDRAAGKVIVAHLGSGASLCGLVNGQSRACTMGFSVLDGLVMGTRCGALDPGVVLYLLQTRHMSVQAVSDMLYQQSGLLGVSGISADMRVLLDSDDARAREAIDLFVYRAATEIGALAAALEGVDALVFTAGIGEHAAEIRQRIAQACAWLGAELDINANHLGQTQFHLPSSRLSLAVIPTDEEKMIALHTLAVLGKLR